MITINVKGKCISFKGHALYDEYGKDIVCASASSIIQTSINASLSLNSESITYEIKDNEIIIKDYTGDNAIKIIGNMLRMLKELSSMYPKNIEIREDEK